MTPTQAVLDHGFVKLRNISGPTRRSEATFDAYDTDPANAARFSFDGADKVHRPEEADLRLAEYLLANKHTTPYEMIEVWLEMKMPIFVARQFVRHRTVSINEVSARYVQLPGEFYIPNPVNVGIKSDTNKQGRTIDGEAHVEACAFREGLIAHCETSYRRYETAIKAGIPNELARCFLPVNVYTHWLWKQDLWNMMHFLRLRMHDHAQFEIRQYAGAIHELLDAQLPELMSLYRKHIMDG